MKKLLSTFLLLWVVSFNSELYAQAFQGQKIVGYIPSWTSAAQVDYTKLTHAIFFPLVHNTQGVLNTMNSWEENLFQEFLMATEDAGIERLVAITEDYHEHFPQDGASMYKLADTLVKFCQLYQLNGINISGWAVEETEHELYNQAIDTLSKYLSAAQLKLVLNVEPLTGTGFTPGEALAKADWLNVMLLALTGTNEESPFGNPSSFEHFLEAENHWVNTREITREKLVMMVPFFGVQFSSPKGGVGEHRLYKDIVSQFPNMSDESNQTPGNDLTCFNGPALIRQKTQYLIDQEFGGIGIWMMTHDAPGAQSLHGQIVCVYEGNTNCRVNDPLTTNLEQSLSKSAVDFFVHNHIAFIESNEEVSVIFTVYDPLGRLIYTSEKMELHKGQNKMELPQTLSGNLIGRMTGEKSAHGKMIYIED